MTFKGVFKSGVETTGSSGVALSLCRCGNRSLPSLSLFPETRAPPFVPESCPEIASFSFESIPEEEPSRS